MYPNSSIYGDALQLAVHRCRYSSCSQWQEYPDRLGLYPSTRKFVLTPQRHDEWCWQKPHLCHGNPYYFVGSAAAGLGSGHESFGLRQVHSCAPPLPSKAPSRYHSRLHCMHVDGSGWRDDSHMQGGAVRGAMRLATWSHHGGAYLK